MSEIDETDPYGVWRERYDALAAENGNLRREKREVPKWWHCPTHGQGKANEWGCPECVRELRDEYEQLRRELDMTENQVRNHKERAAELLRLAWAVCVNEGRKELAVEIETYLGMQEPRSDA